MKEVYNKGNVQLKRLLIATTFSAFTLFLYAPYELYFVNREEFRFTLKMFWWMPILVFIIVEVIIMFIGMMIRGRYKEWYISLLLGLGFCIYIQGNFLNINIGVLNGALINWDEYSTKMMVNVLIWAALILFVFMCSIKMRKYLTYIYNIALFVVGVQILSLIVLFIVYMGENKEFDESMENFQSSDYIYEVGDEENIIVFILDMFDDRYFKEILEMYPERIEYLDGFTYYNNYCGCYSTTGNSTYLLFNGELFLNQDRCEIERENHAANQLFWDELLEKEYEISIYSSAIGNVPNRIKKEAKNIKTNGLKIKSNKEFMKSYYKLAFCKYLPDFIKISCWPHYGEIENLTNDFSPNNSRFRDGLLSDGLQVDEGTKQAKIIHIDGAHYPYYLDRDGNDDFPEHYDNEIENALGVLKILQFYVEEMQKIGVYDNSDIIITSDHGYYYDGLQSNPMLLIKQKNCSGELEINNAPVSQLDVPATLVDLVGGKADKYGESVLSILENEKRDRFFYSYYLQEKAAGNGYRLIEYRINSENNDPESFEMTDVEYTIFGDKIVHSKYCETCKSGGEWWYDAQYPRYVHVPGRNNPSYEYICVDAYK